MSDTRQYKCSTTAVLLVLCYAPHSTFYQIIKAAFLFRISTCLKSAIACLIAPRNASQGKASLIFVQGIKHDMRIARQTIMEYLFSVQGIMTQKLNYTVEMKCNKIPMTSSPAEG